MTRYLLPLLAALSLLIATAALADVGCTTGRPMTSVTLSVGAGSATSTTFSAGASLRFSCNAAVAYAIGPAASVTSTVNSSQLPANSVEKLCTYQTDNAISFFATTAATCWVSTLTR